MKHFIILHSDSPLEILVNVEEIEGARLYASTDTRLDICHPKNGSYTIEVRESPAEIHRLIKESYRSNTGFDE